MYSSFLSKKAGNPFENTPFGSIGSDGRLTSLGNLTLNIRVALVKCYLSCVKAKITSHSGRETSAIAGIDHGLCLRNKSRLV